MDAAARRRALFEEEKRRQAEAEAEAQRMAEVPLALWHAAEAGDMELAVRLAIGLVRSFFCRPLSLRDALHKVGGLALNDLTAHG
jgi:hypothetical protein